MSENQDNFELYTKLVAKICETKLAYLISKDVRLEYIGQEESKIIDKKIEPEKESMSFSIPLETIESSLVVYSELDQVPAIADIFAGGDGKVGPVLSDSQKMVFLDTTTQFLTSVFKFLVYKSDDLQLAYGETRDQILEPGKENIVDMFGNMQAIAFRLKLTIDEASSIELVVNVDKERYEAFIEKLTKIFPSVNLDTIEDQLKKEMSAVKASNRYDIDPSTKKNKEDSLYVVDETRNLDFISDVNLDLIVELGRVDMEFSDVLNLTKGSAIELDRHCSQSVDLYVHNQLVAKGEVIAIDDCFGLKVTEILGSINLFKDLGRVKAVK
jgi:flagellar motor switch protein FliN